MCRSDTSETKTQQKRAFPCADIGTYSPLRFLRGFVKDKHSSLPHPHQARFYRCALTFGFVSYIYYCFVPFTAAPLFCGLAFRYRVSAVRFAWLCGGYWLYSPHNVNYCICQQTDYVDKRSLPLRIATLET